MAPPAGNDGRSEGQRESESGAERVKRERRVDVTFVLDAGTDKDRKTVHAGTDKAVRYLYMPVRTRAGRDLYMPVQTRAGRHGKGRTVPDSYQPAPSDRADSIFPSPS